MQNETASQSGEPSKKDRSTPMMMMTDALANATPVLAAGWSLLYLLFGGGIGGALLIFFGLKAIGR